MMQVEGKWWLVRRVPVVGPRVCATSVSEATLRSCSCRQLALTVEIVVPLAILLNG